MCVSLFYDKSIDKFAVVAFKLSGVAAKSRAVIDDACLCSACSWPFGRLR